MSATAKRIFQNPGKFLRDLKKAVMGLTAEQIAEVLGEMLGGALFDGAVSAITTFLTGGAGGAIAIQKAMKALRKSIKLVDKLIDMAKRAKKFVKCDLLGLGCFVAGTLILTADGEQLPIEQIQVGQRVAIDQTKAESSEPEPKVDSNWVVITVLLPSMTGDKEDQGEVKLLRPMT